VDGMILSKGKKTSETEFEKPESDPEMLILFEKTTTVSKS
jgi:hypothetical protein